MAGDIKLRPYDIGCMPSPSVPAETLVQDSWLTFLLFFACRKTPGPRGHLENLGIAVLECVDCSSTRFGYPNDEGRPEHPLHGYGLDRPGIETVEVLNSPWAAEIHDQKMRSQKRIWGARGFDLPEISRPSRHFVIPLKEMTFECVAAEMAVAIYASDFDAAFAWVRKRLSEH